MTEASAIDLLIGIGGAYVAFFAVCVVMALHGVPTFGCRNRAKVIPNTGAVPPRG